MSLHNRQSFLKTALYFSKYQQKPPRLSSSGTVSGPSLNVKSNATLATLAPRDLHPLTTINAKFPWALEEKAMSMEILECFLLSPLRQMIVKWWWQECFWNFPMLNDPERTYKNSKTIYAYAGPQHLFIMQHWFLASGRLNRTFIHILYTCPFPSLSTHVLVFPQPPRPHVVMGCTFCTRVQFGFAHCFGYALGLLFNFSGCLHRPLTLTCWSCRCGVHQSGLAVHIWLGPGEEKFS